MKVYINNDTYDITDDSNNAFLVDELISKTISLLNKKGYKTMACCSGHLLKGDDRYYIHYVNEEEVKLYKNEEYKAIVEYCEEKKLYRIKSLILGLGCYIKFETDIQLPNIPDGFEYNKVSNDLSFMLCYYVDDEYKILKSDKEILDTINMINNELYKWAIKLEIIND